MAGATTQREYGGGRRGRRSYAEVAKGIPNLFGNTLNQCLCGLQGINGWEGAWGLLVWGFAALLGLEGCGHGNERRGRGEFAEGAEGIRGRTQKTQKLRRSRRRNTKLFEKVGKRHLPAIPASSQKPVIPAQAGIYGCASYAAGFPPARE